MFDGGVESGLLLILNPTANSEEVVHSPEIWFTENLRSLNWWQHPEVAAYICS